MDDTKIQWTDATWNPVAGCSRVSPGCDHCYAIGVARRFGGPGRPFEGLTTIRRGRPDWSGEVRFLEDRLDQPLRWKRPRRIFVNSMSDLFHESLSNEQIAAIFAVMAVAWQHTFQILTKRPERMRDWFLWLRTRVVPRERDVNSERLALTWEGWRAGAPLPNSLGVPGWALAGHGPWPLPNVWLGVSCEDQATADERIPLLLETPAAVRFVSAEPLLGPIDFRKVRVMDLSAERRIDWAIVGGESGPGARPCALEWIERIVGACRDGNVACFVKQLGACVVSEERTAPADAFEVLLGRKPRSGLAPSGEHWAWSAGLIHPKGGDPSEWPDDLRVREWPGQVRP